MVDVDDDLLGVETRWYDEHAKDLLLAHPNRYLLISGEAVIGHYEHHSEAVAEGVRRYGQGPFLVRRTGDKAPVLTVPALTLGLLRNCRLWRPHLL